MVGCTMHGSAEVFCTGTGIQVGLCMAFMSPAHIHSNVFPSVIASLHQSHVHACERMCLHLAQDVVQRVGSRGALGDFARAVCARLAPQLMSMQHVEELLKLAQKEAPLGGIYLGSALELLVDVAANSPSLFAELAPQVRRTRNRKNSLEVPV